MHKLEGLRKKVIGLAPKILLDSYGRKVIDAIGIGIKPDGSAFNIGIGQIDYGQFNKPIRVMGICFAAGLLVKEHYEKVGNLDESYFAYYEDVDWCYRANMFGYEFYTCPNAIVYHGHSVSAKKTFTFYEKYYLIHRNLLKTLIKNYYRGNQIRSMIRLYNNLRYGYCNLVSKNFKMSLTILRIGFHIIMRFPSLLFFNYKINKKRIMFDSEIWQLSNGTLFDLAPLSFDTIKYCPKIGIGIIRVILSKLNIFENIECMKDYISITMLSQYLEDDDWIINVFGNSYDNWDLTKKHVKGDMLIKKRSTEFIVERYGEKILLDASLVYVLLQIIDNRISVLENEIINKIRKEDDFFIKDMINRGLKIINNMFIQIEFIK
jgi:hypothetical protein